MSSSADHRSGHRVLRAAHSAELAVARVVAPRGTVVAVARHPDALLTAPTLEERLATERRIGYEEGFAAGEADAAAAAERERAESLLEMRASVERACERVAEARRSIVAEVVDEAVDLAFELVSALLEHELSLRESPERDAVRRALALAPAGEDVRIRLHPGSPVTADELRTLVSASSVSVVSDPSIEVTGCVVEVGACRIDAQIGAALERVRAALDEVRSRVRDEVVA